MVCELAALGTPEPLLHPCDKQPLSPAAGALAAPTGTPSTAQAHRRGRGSQPYQSASPAVEASQCGRRAGDEFGVFPEARKVAWPTLDLLDS